MADTSQPTLEYVVGLVRKHLPEHEVENVYLFGSRLYGCAQPDSDYDFYVLVSGRPFFAGAWGHGVKVPPSTGPAVELNIYHIDFFRDLIKQQVLWAYVVPFFPRAFVWAERSPLVAGPIQRYCFAMNVASELDYKWDKARHMFTKQNDRVMGVKALVVGLRYCLQAAQFLASGSLSDFSIGNDFYYEAKKAEYDDWKQVEARWRGESDKLRETVMGATTVVNLIVASQPPPQPGYSVLSATPRMFLFEFLRKYGVGRFLSELSIETHRHPDNPKVLHLSTDMVNSSHRLFVSHECRGIVLELDEQERSGRLICGPLPFFPSHNALFEDFDWASFRVFEHLDGKTVHLYYYHDQWRVSTRYSVTGVESQIGFPARRSSFSGWRIESPVLFAAPSLRGDIASEFWKVWKEKGYQFPEAREGTTYSFKLQTKLSLRILPYPGADDLVLYSVRKVTPNGQQMEDLEHEEVARQHGWSSAREFRHLTDLRAALLRTAAELDPLVCKGFVLVCKGGTRAKCPAGQLEILRHLDQGAIPRSIYRDFVEVLRLSPHRSFLTRLDFPHQWDDLFRDADAHVSKFASIHQAEFDKVTDPSSEQFEANLRAKVKDVRMITLYRNAYQKYDGSVRRAIGSLTRKAFVSTLEEMGLHGPPSSASFPSANTTSEVT